MVDNGWVNAYVVGSGDAQARVGAWVLVLAFRGIEKVFRGHECEATGPRMELFAGAEALRRLSRPCAVRIASTSQYLVRGMTEWLPGWVANGWRGSHGPVHNRDLWEALEKTAARHRIEWVWVRSGTHPWARRCEEALMEEIAAGKTLCAEECDVPNPLDWSPTPVVRQGSLFAPGPRLGGG